MITMMQISKWKKARFERDSRYYLLLIEQDLFETWIVIRVNGGIGTKLGELFGKLILLMKRRGCDIGS